MKKMIYYTYCFAIDHLYFTLKVVKQCRKICWLIKIFTTFFGINFQQLEYLKAFEYTYKHFP